MILTDLDIQEKVRNNNPEIFDNMFGLLLENAEGYEPAQMTPEQIRLNEDTINRLTPYQTPVITAPLNTKRMYSWRFVRMNTANKKTFLVFDQKTGSCVGNGGGQALWYRSAIDVFVGDPEKFHNDPPFYLYTYGRSRFRAGMRLRGSGSFGSTFAEAAKLDGMFFSTESGLPPPDMQDGDGITWGRGTALDWSTISDNSSLQQKWSPLAKQHLIEVTAPIKDALTLRSVIVNNLGTATIASTWGGLMQCPLEGPEGNRRRMNRRSGRWPHQMSVIAWEEHPTLGSIFCVLNSWSTRAHGTINKGGELVADDSMAPAGSFWLPEAEMDYICRTGEVYGFLNYAGYPIAANDRILQIHSY